VCGGALTARFSTKGGYRYFGHFCLTNVQRGRAVCANDVGLPMKDVDDLVVTMFEREQLGPAVVMSSIQEAVRRRQAARGARSAASVAKPLERRMARIVAGSKMVAMSRSRPPHARQTRKLMSAFSASLMLLALRVHRAHRPGRRYVVK
jgi:hypothetical protein